MSTHVMYAALRDRFCGPEWAVFFEVANGTGSHGRRYADAVAMNLYPSRGLEINGVEVKVSRSDWLRELKNPKKAEDVYRYCDRWWLAVSDPNIVQLGELPATWGLMILTGKSLKIATQAPKLEPVPLDRTFFAALCRRASEVPEAQVKALVEKRVEEHRERWTYGDRQAAERARNELAELRRKVSEFENVAGFSITQAYGWRDRDPKAVGAAVRFVLDGGMRGLDEPLANMEQAATRLMDTIKTARAANAEPAEVASLVSPKRVDL